MKLKEINKHERDSKIIFDEGPHIYYINGSCDGYISVTTLIHKFFPKFDANNIIDKMMNSMNWEKSKYFGMTRKEILNQWEENRNDAAIKGTKMHQDIEYYFNDIKIDNTSKEFGYFLDFVKDNPELKPYRTEWEVFDTDLKLAGSIDMLFEHEDELIIYDWKRSKDIKKDNHFDTGYDPVSSLPHSNFWHYSLQLNIYKAILQKNYDKKVKELYLLWLHPDKNSYVKLKVPDLSKEVSDLFSERLIQLNNLVPTSSISR